MPGMKLRAVLLVVMAVIVASGSIGAAYACYEPPWSPPHHPGHPQALDLRICDQDEVWGDGVEGTWTAHNMAPGDEFVFDGAFAGLSGRLPRHADNGLLGITCDYNKWSASQPDNMAKYMVITRCVYSCTEKHRACEIDCLTGKSTFSRWKVNRDWQVQDVDRDGRITFFDLKKRPLKNLPSCEDDGASFEMSVRFHESAGNEFQGDTFDLTMIYTLKAG